MTCIVGLVHEGEVHLGADSAGVSGFSASNRADRKLVRNGGFLMGFTSSFRMGQLLGYSLKPPKRHPDADLYTFMVTDFINAVRECFREGGFTTTVDGVERGGCFLVGYQGRLFTIYSDFQVGENLEPYAACGCGDDLALGALYATSGMQPKERITIALSAAQTFSAGVRAPFVFEVL